MDEDSEFEIEDGDDIQIIELVPRHVTWRHFLSLGANFIADVAIDVASHMRLVSQLITCDNLAREQAATADEFKRELLSLDMKE